MARKKSHVSGRPGEIAGLRHYAELLVRAALAEDIGSGDKTTVAIINPGQKGAAVFLAKEDMVLAGAFVAETVFRCLDAEAAFKSYFKEGEEVKRGRVIAAVSGNLGAILTGERVALNFLQRLCGIATLTKKFTKKVRSTKAKILDTRKTTPCLRVLEKYAVKTGGGYNHRFGLFDAVLIKDNHIKAAGGVNEAVRRVDKKYSGSVLLEVEANSLKEVKDSVKSGADIIMLDNMGVPEIKKALKIIENRALVEASGGITLDNVAKIAKTGVNFISVGGLTHSAKAMDISMEVISYAGKRGSGSGDHKNP